MCLAAICLGLCYCSKRLPNSLSNATNLKELNNVTLSIRRHFSTSRLAVCDVNYKFTIQAVGLFQLS